MIRIALCLLLCAAAASASAESSFSLQPKSAGAGEPVALRVGESDGCYEFDNYYVERQGSQVTVDIWVSDFVVLPCPANRTPPLSLALGAFAPGVYSVRVRECGFAPVDPCFERTTLALPVSSELRRQAIPAIGGIAGMLLATGAMLFALWKLTGRGAAPRR